MCEFFTLYKLTRFNNISATATKFKYFIKFIIGIPKAEKNALIVDIYIELQAPPEQTVTELDMTVIIKLTIV